MAKTSQAKRIFGTTEAVAQMDHLVCGPLRAQLIGGNLGAVTFGGVEVLRGISYLVRDQNWGTCPVRIFRLTKKKFKGRLVISYTARTRNGDSVLTWRANIIATAQSLTFTAIAKPDQDFKTNRTGFVVLHPINGVEGRPLKVTHTNGTIETARFPKLINPGQPFFDIRALEHRPSAGLKARVEMQGHKFEMEDQHNWTDASFKTYVCSLLDPWPYVLKADETFTQAVQLQIEGTVRSQVTNAARAIKKIPSLGVNRLPEIGLAISPDDVDDTVKHVAMLRDLKPDFLSCYMDKDTPTTALRSYARLARDTKLPVTLELVVPGLRSAEEEVARCAAGVAAASLDPQSVVITQAQDLKSFQPLDQRPWGPNYEELALAARSQFPKAVIGGGMISFFTELNRKQPPRGVFDFVTHSICPIVHDASDAAVMQTLESLPHIFSSAKAFIGKTPYHLGPTTIAARLNPYGATVTPNPKNRRICLAPNDPRQFGTFAVAWNKRLIEEAGHAGIRRLTLGGLCGPRGLLANAENAVTPHGIRHYIDDGPFFKLPLSGSIFFANSMHFMNEAGPNNPRSGCRQRNNASAPVICLLSRLTCG